MIIYEGKYPYKEDYFGNQEFQNEYDGKAILFWVFVLITVMLTSCHATSKASEGNLPESNMSESVAYVWNDSLPEWVNHLNGIALPKSMQNEKLIDVYFKYNQLVNGYEVTARWRVFGADYETGMVLMNFRNPETGKEFQYYNTDKYNSVDTDKVSFAKDFKGHHHGDIHYFDYTSPKAPKNKEYYPDSPLGYYTPFQFLDVDFDGEDELLISDWYQGRGGNGYKVYDIETKGLEKLDYMPLDRLTNADKINLKKKTITIKDSDGAYDYAEFTFKLKERKDSITGLPEFYSHCAQSFDFGRYNNELGSPFILVSIKEYMKSDVEHRASYKVKGKKIIKK